MKRTESTLAWCAIHCLRGAGRSAAALAALVVIAWALTGCSVLVRGTSQGIPVNSVPAGATVTVDGKEVGVTPVTVLLSRASEHTVIVKRGSQERTIVLRPHGPDAEAIGLTVAEAVPGAVATVWLALNPCPPYQPPACGGWNDICFSVGDLCPGFHNTALAISIGAAVVPAVIDLAFNSYDHLEPDKVEVDF